MTYDPKKFTVNWEEQWALFAESSFDGKAHIDLSQFGGASTLLLLPGPGFGDLSHPTTYLMLKMMQNRVQNLPVLDIGTGSGILALAALSLGPPLQSVSTLIRKLSYMRAPMQNSTT